MQAIPIFSEEEGGFSGTSSGEKIRTGLDQLLFQEMGERHYHNADLLWKERAALWADHGKCHYEREEGKSRFQRAQEQEEKAREADATRDENRIGRLKERIEQVASVLHAVPEPTVQMAAAGTDTLASALGWVNLIWSKVDLARAMVERNRSQTAFEAACQEAEAANLAVIGLEAEAKRREVEAQEKEKEGIQQLAAKLQPQESWGEVEWQQWSPLFLGKHPSQEAHFEFIQAARTNYSWVKEEVARAWQGSARHHERKAWFLEKEAAKKLSFLKERSDLAKKDFEEKKRLSQAALQRLQRGEERENELKEKIETFLEIKEPVWDHRRINERRSNFVADFEELIETRRGMAALREDWEKASREEEEAAKLLLQTTQEEEEKNENYTRSLQRARVRSQALQQELLHHWPELDESYRPYLEWELPFEEKEGERNVETRDPAFPTNTSPSEGVTPPLQSQRELEAQGRRLFYEDQRYLQKKWEDPFSPSLGKRIIQNEETTENSSETAPLSSETGSENGTSVLASPYEELLSWSIAQLDRPTPDAQNKKRWKLRKQLLMLRRETRQLAQRIMQQQKEEAAENMSSFSIGSFRTTDTQTRKAPSRLSWISTTTKNSVFSDASSHVRESLQQDFQEATRAEEEKAKEWLEVVECAEKTRKRDTRGSSLGDEASTINAWADADDQVLLEQEHRRRLIEEKQTAQEIEKSWERNNRRWEARATADRLERKLALLQREKDQLSTQNEGEKLARGRVLKQQIQETLQELEEAERSWEEKAQEHSRLQLEESHEELGTPTESREPVERSPEKQRILQQLKELDQAVVNRWEQLQLQQNPPDAETAALVQSKSNLDYTLDLRFKLEEEQIAAFTFSRERPTVLQAASVYQKATRKEALRAARENIPGAEQAWNRRTREGKENLENVRKQLADSAAPFSSRAALTDQLPQLEALVQAEQKAFVHFQNEKKRLDRIESLWKSIQKVQAEAKEKERRKAAWDYHQGFPDAWLGLSQEERDAYNSCIAEENSRYQQEIAAERLFLVEIKQQLELGKGRVNQLLSRLRGALSALTGRQQKTLEFLQEAQSYYQNRYEAFIAEEKQRRKAIQWLNWKELVPEEREERWSELQQGEEKRKSEEQSWESANAAVAPGNAMALLWNRVISSSEEAAEAWKQLVGSYRRAQSLNVWRRAQKAGSRADAAQTEASDASVQEAEPLWDKAIELQQESAAAWEEVVREFQKELRKAAERFKENWRKDLEAAENGKAKVTALITWRRAQKADSRADAAQGEASAASDQEAEPLWDKAIELQQQSAAAWEKVVREHQEGLGKASECFKENWRRDLLIAENAKALALVISDWFQLQRESLALLNLSSFRQETAEVLLSQSQRVIDAAQVAQSSSMHLQAIYQKEAADAARSGDHEYQAIMIKNFQHQESYQTLWSARKASAAALLLFSQSWLQKRNAAATAEEMEENMALEAIFTTCRRATEIYESGLPHARDNMQSLWRAELKQSEELKDILVRCLLTH